MLQLMTNQFPSNKENCSSNLDNDHLERDEDQDRSELTVSRELFDRFQCNKAAIEQKIKEIKNLSKKNDFKALEELLRPFSEQMLLMLVIHRRMHLLKWCCCKLYIGVLEMLAQKLPKYFPRLITSQNWRPLKYALKSLQMNNQKKKYAFRETIRALRCFVVVNPDAIGIIARSEYSFPVLLKDLDIVYKTMIMEHYISSQCTAKAPNSSLKDSSKDVEERKN
jgi:hypothetical protein